MEVVPLAGVPHAVWVSYPSFLPQWARLLEQPDPIKNRPCPSWHGVFICHSGHVVVGRVLVEGQRRERWGHGGLYTELQ